MQGGFTSIFEWDFMRWGNSPPLSISLKKKSYFAEKNLTILKKAVLLQRQNNRETQNKLIIDHLNSKHYERGKNNHGNQSNIQGKL